MVYVVWEDKVQMTLRPPTPPFEAILLYGRNRLKRKNNVCFNQFQIYDNIAEKGCAGGLKVALYVCPNNTDDDIHPDHSYPHTLGIPLNSTLRPPAPPFSAIL